MDFKFASTHLKWEILDCLNRLELDLDWRMETVEREKGLVLVSNAVSPAAYRTASLIWSLSQNEVAAEKTSSQASKLR